jgi:hypothetical protein
MSVLSLDYLAAFHYLPRLKGPFVPPGTRKHPAANLVAGEPDPLPAVLDIFGTVLLVPALVVRQRRFRPT